MILAWLLLLTGLIISAVAIYYSVVGLAAIFSAAVIPIIVMGTTLEIAKLVCASWLKANWERAPRLMKIYMTTAVIVLMLITSMGIFGFLSKAHSDQSLVSGDVLSRISIYDEKIKTSKDNIEANRKALRQMDEAVDQSMARSTTEQGANRAVSIRQSQARERTRLQNEIVAEQKNIAKLNDEAAPIRAEVRKVEAEVGPLKYIAAFIYGETDETLLEKAVTWVIITIIVVFDPLAVIMLLAAQMTFGWRKEDPLEVKDSPEPFPYAFTDIPVYDDYGPNTKAQPKQDDSPLNNEQLADIKKMSEPYVSPLPNIQTSQIAEYVESHVPPKNETPLTALGGDITAPEEPIVPGTTESELDKWNKMLEEAEKAVEEEKKELEQVQPLEPDLPIDSKKKTYMTKDTSGQIQIKEKK
jgi:hypothetical protein